MSDESNKPTATATGVARIYMKSGNVITLNRVIELTWEQERIGRTIKINQGGAFGGERLMVKSLDLDQVEAITFENPTPEDAA